LGALVMLALPGTIAARAAAVTVRDATGRIISIADPARIVSIGGSVTEILYALGQEHRIVAVDTSSLFPASALQQKPNVGYLRQLSPEGVLGLSPSLVISVEGAGPREAITVIEGAAVPFVHVPDRFTGEGIIDKIKLIAAATGTQTRGECLAAQVRKDLTALDDPALRPAQKQRVLFILSFMNGRAMVAGRNTAADGVIRMAGGENVMGEIEGYKIVNDEAIVAAQPQTVLGMERPGFVLTAQEVFSHPAFGTTPAAASKSFVAMDGLYLLGFGPRTARAARDLAHALYPSLAAVTLPSDRTNPVEACRQ
jgi:iron complex transport system substrate-binding protein